MSERFREFLRQPQTFQGSGHLVGPSNSAEVDDFGNTEHDQDQGFVVEQDQTDTSLVYRGFSIAVRALINPAYFHCDMQNPTKDVDIYNILLDSEDMSTYILAKVVFELVEEQHLSLTLKALESLVEIVTDLLRIYVYKRLPVTRFLVYQLLSATLYTWADEDGMTSEAGALLLPLWYWCTDAVSEGRCNDWRDRHRVLSLLSDFLRRDPSELCWCEEDLGSQERHGPAAVMMTMIEDSDVRVRIKAATSVPRLLQLDIPLSSRPGQFYLQVAHQFGYQGEDQEVILTRSILMMNVIIASSGARRSPLFHLYDLVSGHPSLYMHVQSIFGAITTLLRLESFSRMYLEYAARLLAAQGKEGQDPFEIPVTLYGFQSREKWARETLRVAGSSLLLSPECDGFWGALRELARLERDDTLEQNIPNALAITAALKAPKDRTGRAYSAELSRLRQHFSSISPHSEKLLDPNHNQLAIMIAMLFQLPDETMSPFQVFELLSSMDPGHTNHHDADIYKALLFPSDGLQVSELQETTTPKNSSKNVLTALGMLENSYKLDKSMVAVNTILQLTCRIAGSCLTNERLRMVNNLALLIAYYPDVIRITAIFDLFLRAIVCLFHEQDLAAAMVNFLSWGLEQIVQGLVNFRTPSPSLSNLANKAKYYTEETSTNHAVLVLVGGKALSIVEDFLEKILLGETEPRDELVQSSLYRECQLLLLIWPRRLPETLDRLCTGLSYPLVNGYAMSYYDVRGKFSLAKQLESRSQPAGSLGSFRQSTFWQLQSAISDSGRISMEDMDSFLDLLYQSEGIVEMPDNPTINNLSGTAGLPTTELKEANRGDPKATSKRRILTLMLDNMLGPHLENTGSAYQALAGITCLSPNIYQTATLTSLTQRLLKLLALTAPVPACKTGVLTDLDDMSASKGKWLVAHGEPSIWARDFARLLFAELGSRLDQGYLFVLYVLDDPTISIEGFIAPALHLLLHSDSEISAKSDRTVSDTITRYFNWLLSHEDLPTDCARIIIQCVLYLQNFALPDSLGKGAKATWLEIDEVRLSVASLRCKLPESALFFWELSRDGATDNTDLSDTAISVCE